MSNTILVAYATREGHTRDIAGHVGARLRELGLDVTVHDLAQGDVDPLPFDRVVLAASVHMGHHEKEAVAFARKHRLALEARRATLLSVSLSEAAAEHADQPGERQRASLEARHQVDVFTGETGWAPRHVELVGGALLYTHYNWLMRLIMRRIARGGGILGDASTDHDYTDWASLDRFAAELAAGLSAPPGQPTRPAA